MPDETLHEIETTTLKSYLVSAVYAVVGVSGLAAIDYKSHEMPHIPWWLLALQNAFAIIAGTGFIGILFEVALRRNFVVETVVRLKTLFDEDSNFASRLSDSARERRVENTLKAHLGPELGRAIFLGLVHRYFAQPTRYRKDAKLKVTLSSCSEMKINSLLPDDAKVDEMNYCRLLADYSFKIKFPNFGIITVICTLSDEMSDLYTIFRRPDCIAREVIQLDAIDREIIVDAFRNTKKDRWPKLIQSIAHAEVSVNGDKLSQVSAKFLEDSLSLVFEFDSSGRPDTSDLDRYQVIIKSIFLRSSGRFPIVLAEPTYNPYIELAYPDARLIKVASAPFLTSDTPFEPRVTNDEELRRIAIDTTNNKGEPAWVFPSSGVIFTWQSQ